MNVKERHLSFGRIHTIERKILFVNYYLDSVRIYKYCRNKGNLPRNILNKIEKMAFLKESAFARGGFSRGNF
ncbi:hypothetical protein CD29_11725 [Ureibacillus manganicus DSM 26584]|uniref:Uncharacterized protein n=1 Tax=Ureibacillus manganicus DSM 26584 TaxID=1384049 RepID=A0A0A3I6R0_9BACL|nr:hypothetical protein CD29_11725 [Ureibacillus manganicus DSM 26584]